MKVEKIWVIRSGGKFIALDESSGGYPYETTFWNAKRFIDPKSAIRYSSIGSNTNGWEIYECDEVGVKVAQAVRGKEDMYQIELAELNAKYGKHDNA